MLWVYISLFALDDLFAHNFFIGFLNVLGDFMTLTFLHLMTLILKLTLDIVMVHPHTKFEVSM